ncbi:MAG TPA: hypothetical protein VK112_04980 [Fodinibius sp.]|nr:hypothetical protein [Fodinibius sp.]
MFNKSSFDPEVIIKTLAKHQVNYILIGALAARLQGFPRMTADTDITPAQDIGNIERLAQALNELNTRVFTESVPIGLPFDCSAANLKQSRLWNFITDAGRLDVAFKPIGTDGYNDLIKNAEKYKVYGETIYAASLEDIIRSKKAADRPQDRQDVIILREILKRKK